MGTLFEMILTEAYGRIGYDVTVESVPGERGLVMANQGVVDGEAGRVPVIEPVCPNLIRIPTPLYTNQVVAFTRDKKPDVAGKGWEALYPFRLGTVRGYKYVEKMTASMNRVLVSCYHKLFQLLEEGRIDVAVAEYMDSLPALHSFQSKEIHVVLPPLSYNPMYHYLHKRHADLVPKIDQALRDMQREGRILAIQHELENKHGTSPCTQRIELSPEPSVDGDGQ